MTTNRPIHPGGPQLRCPGVMLEHCGCGVNAAAPFDEDGDGIGELCRRCGEFISYRSGHDDGCCDRHELDARRADLRLGVIVERSVAVRAIRALAESAR